MTTNQPNYLTTADLMARWKCGYRAANEFMHRKDVKAIKPSKLLLVNEKEVIAYEKARQLRP